MTKALTDVERRQINMCIDCKHIHFTKGAHQHVICICLQARELAKHRVDGCADSLPHWQLAGMQNGGIAALLARRNGDKLSVGCIVVSVPDKVGPVLFIQNRVPVV